jgi:hypothetical protein
MPKKLSRKIEPGSDLNPRDLDPNDTIVSTSVKLQDYNYGCWDIVKIAELHLNHKADQNLQDTSH